MIGSGTLTKQIAGYLARTRFDALDDDALRATKEHILYTLGTILAGSSAPGIKQALAGAQALSGRANESSVLVTGERLPAASAALVNATMGHSRELDINDDRIAYKSSITVIPAALALAEKAGKISGKDFLTAVCLGVDLGIRLGLATNPKPVHARAIALGPFAAAAGCGKILNLDEDGMHNALGIAFCRSTVAGNSTVAPSLTKRLGVGFASQSGVVAAPLASVGAATLVSGGLSLEEVYQRETAQRRDPRSRCRVKTILTPEFDHGPMDVKPQVVEIIMRDGKVFSEKVIYPKGNPNNPVTSEELVAAFRGMASYAAKPLSGAKIDDAALAQRLEDVDDVAVLAKLLTA